MKKLVKNEYVIIVSRFNEFITGRLLDGCLDELEKQGIKRNNVSVIWVPGAFEIPVTALKAAKKKNVSAVICLGSVIRGETLHYELVANSTAQGIMQASLLTGKPIVFEVLATDTVELAQKRAQEQGDNKGRDAARTAVEMVDTLNNI